MPWELCSKEDVTEMHPIPVNELRDDWSTMVEALIRQHMGQPDLGKVTVITDEYYNGNGLALLTLRRTPILSVQSVYVGGSLIGPADYVVEPTFIMLKNQVFENGLMNVVVSYTAGTNEVDDVTRLAAISMVIAIINYRRRAGADSSLKWGSAEQKVGEDNPNVQVGLTSHLTTIMRRLLRRPKARVRYA